MKRSTMPWWWVQWASIVVALCAWEGTSRSKLVSPALFPPPTAVLKSLISVAADGELTTNIWASIRRVSLGLTCGSLIGAGVGLLTGRMRLIRCILAPIFGVMRPLPPVALIPLMIVWFGIGESAKVISITIAVLMPVWLNVHSGAENVPAEYTWSAQSLGLSSIETFMFVIFPGTAQAILVGIRAGVAVAFTMVFVSEIAGASSGIGYAISTYHLAYRIDHMMAYLLVLGSLGAAADWFVQLLGRVICPWLKGPPIIRQAMS